MKGNFEIQVESQLYEGWGCLSCGLKSTGFLIIMYDQALKFLPKRRRKNGIDDERANECELFKKNQFGLFSRKRMTKAIPRL